MSILLKMVAYTGRKHEYRFFLEIDGGERIEVGGFDSGAVLGEFDLSRWLRPINPDRFANLGNKYEGRRDFAADVLDNERKRERYARDAELNRACADDWIDALKYGARAMHPGRDFDRDAFDNVRDMIAATIIDEDQHRVQEMCAGHIQFKVPRSMSATEAEQMKVLYNNRLYQCYDCDIGDNTIRAKPHGWEPEQDRHTAWATPTYGRLSVAEGPNIEPVLKDAEHHGLLATESRVGDIVDEDVDESPKMLDIPDGAETLLVFAGRPYELTRFLERHKAKVPNGKRLVYLSTSMIDELPLVFSYAVLGSYRGRKDWPEFERKLESCPAAKKVELP